MTAVTSDPQTAVLDHLRTLIANDEDVVQAAREVFVTARQSQEHINWFMGDAANIILKAPGPKYGKKALKKVAKDSNCSVKTLYERAAVADFYIPEARALYAAEPTLSYSHLRTAMKLKEPRLAHEFLMKTAEQAYTVEECRIELLKETGKPVPPVKVGEAQMCVHRITVSGEVCVSFDEMPDLQPGEVYTVHIYKLSEG